MKKRIKLFISSVLALLCFCCCFLCGCSGNIENNKYSKSYSNINEVVDLFTSEEDLFDTVYNKDIMNIMKENSSITCYFKEEKESEKIYKLLHDKGIDYGIIADLYEAFNESDWYNYIAVEGSDGKYVPFLLMAGGRPTNKKIVDSIKYQFKNPDSVSILKSTLYYKKLENGAKRFPYPISYQIYVRVNAMNGFGGYGTSEYILDGSSLNIFSVSSEYTFVSYFLLNSLMEKMGYLLWY